MTLSEPPTGTLHQGAATNGASANGGSANGGLPQRPPKPGGISMRPAMVVLGIAVLILCLFFVIGITSSPAPVPARHGAASGAVPGSALRSVPAAGLLAPIVRAGEPPANVVDAVVVPRGATRVAHSDTNAGAGQYDAQVTVRSGADQAELIDFFASAMKLEGWQVFSRGPADHDPNTVEILGKLAGTDGYYWEMGALVPPTTFAANTATAAGRGQTNVTIRLFQVPDSQ